MELNKTMYCSYCGEAISKGTLYCLKCGHPTNKNMNLNYSNGSKNVYRPFQEPRPGRPNPMLWLAILTTICCCIPFGIYAIILSCKVDDLYNAGEYERAKMAAADSRKWSVIGIIISSIFYVVVFVIYVILIIITDGEIHQ